MKRKIEIGPAYLPWNDKKYYTHCGRCDLILSARRKRMLPMVVRLHEFWHWRRETMWKWRALKRSLTGKENKLMSVMTPVPKDDPMMKAWEAFKRTEEYANAKSWAADPKHLEGSLWAMYCQGYRDATARAGDLHEQIDPASDAERLSGAPGAGAMGAVIEYRDKIRRTAAAA